MEHTPPIASMVMMVGDDHARPWPPSDTGMRIKMIANVPNTNPPKSTIRTVSLKFVFGIFDGKTFQDATAAHNAKGARR